MNIEEREINIAHRLGQFDCDYDIILEKKIAFWQFPRLEAIMPCY
jgi:hypothetical protein